MTAITLSAGGGVSPFTLAIGPEDEFDDSANGDPDSLNGEEDETGFDDMPLANGWEDEGDDEEEDGEEDEDDC